MHPWEIADQINFHLNILHIERTMTFDQELDSIFGIVFKKLDSTVQELYPELDAAALSTSYLDYYRLLSYLGRDQVLVDLGAGYCRGTLLAEYMGLAKCLSLELSEDRIESAKAACIKIDGDLSWIRLADLATFSLPIGDLYYLYFPLNRVFLRLIKELQNINAKVAVCESHGDVIPFMDQLKFKNKQLLYQTASSRHDSHVYLYQLEAELHEINYRESLVRWWLQHFDRKGWVEFKYFHQILNKDVKHRVLIEDLELVYLDKKFYLQSSTTGRIYNTDVDFTFGKLIESQYFDVALAGKVKEKFGARSKIYIDSEMFVENSQGQLYKWRDT